MNGVLVDSCVLLDLFTDDPVWGDWAESVLERYSRTNTLEGTSKNRREWFERKADAAERPRHIR